MERLSADQEEGSAGREAETCRGDETETTADGCQEGTRGGGKGKVIGH